MQHRFKFKAGDRVDYGSPGFENGTPGTVRNRIHTKHLPAYAIEWDDGNEDNSTYWEHEIMALKGEASDRNNV